MPTRCIHLASPATAGLLWLVAALFAALLGLMPTRTVTAASNLVVTDTSDADHGTCALGNCTLRDAIKAANTKVTPTTIRFSISGTLFLTTSLPAINNEITIDGTGHAITVSGHLTRQLLLVNSGKTFHLQSITIANVTNPTCIAAPTCTLIYNTGMMSVMSSTFSNNEVIWIGGIYNEGTLSVIHSAFSDNTVGWAGGIFNTGVLSVSGSTFSNNIVEGSGGGIFNTGVVSVSGSTFSNNSVGGSGGGIYSNGTLSIINSTFADNEATYDGGGILNGGSTTILNSTFLGNNAYDWYDIGGGGIYQYGPLMITNSIIANSYDGDCVSSAMPAVGSHNLIRSGYFTCGLTNGVNGNLIGYDPKLSPLGNHGGSTRTFLPLPGSPAINAGDNTACPAFDQRGVSRPHDGICDIGAVETLTWLRVLLPQVMQSPFSQ